MLESQLALLREQLDVERKRRLELQHRGRSKPAERQYGRAADFRMSRKTLQRQKSPFRVHRAVSCEMYQRSYRYEASLSSISTCSYLTNDTSTSVETTTIV
ncbi:unnamed protein product [Cylicocyclus nassatus]|uniref:Uncharacterized protein n=1 Tax=Cylicocyclus nassatus TaxID=53992 RepID=A0AA36H7H7_CYLNA|nr:unnamed protein product [Cylicocyclus nassatus]